MNKHFFIAIPGTKSEMDDLPARYKKSLSPDWVHPVVRQSGHNRHYADVFSSIHYDLFFSTIGLDNPIHRDSVPFLQ